jgi:hypothetical protein
MREGQCRAIHPEAPPLVPWPACLPSSSAYLSNNKNQDKSRPPDLFASLVSIIVSFNLSHSSVARLHQRIDCANHQLTSLKEDYCRRPSSEARMGHMEREDWVKDRQGANGTAPTAVLTAMSSFPSLVSIPFSLQVSAYLLILHWIIPPHRTTVWGGPEGASPRVLRLAHRASRPLEAPKVRGTLRRRSHIVVAETPKSVLTVWMSDV